MSPLLCMILGIAIPAMQTPDSAETCGRCHRAIHEAWKTSVHAHAMESRLFQDALELAQSDYGAEARRACLGCHAPVAARIGDDSLQRKVSWEGVTCDFCHSIQDVSLAGPNPRAKVAFTLIKSGPLKDAHSTGHGTVFSAVHTSSLACVICHEYRNPAGFAVLTTYSEWKNSQAARDGKDCQSCHMYQVEGNVVDPRILRSREAVINLHQMPGSHSIEQLNRTVGAMLSTTHQNGQLKVNIDVMNRTAGHSVPTGSPLREIRLEVSADAYDGQHFRAERIYRREVADAQGRPIDREHVAMWRAARLISDTRLASGEKRSEVFMFPVPSGVQAQVKATFWYYYSPTARTEAQKRVTFLTLQRLVR